MTEKTGISLFFWNNTTGGKYMTFGYRYRKQIIISVIGILLLLGVGAFFIFYDRGEEVTEEEEEPVIEKVEKKKEEEEEYSVDIKGEVKSPGIYTMPKNARVIDVINKAGGLTENADTTVINLSKKIKDEMVIIIYSREEVASFEETREKEKYLQEKCLQKDENSLKNDACISDTQTGSTKININTATLNELMTLSGIGEAKAKDIINYRETVGPFQTIEDIKKVSGIGDSLFAQIKENITV